MLNFCGKSTRTPPCINNSGSRESYASKNGPHVVRRSSATTKIGEPPALPGRQSWFDIAGSPSRILGCVSRQSTRREASPDGPVGKPTSYELGVQSPGGFSPQGPTTDAVRAPPTSSRGGGSPLGRAAGKSARRRARVAGSRPQGEGDAPAVRGVTGHRVYQGQKRASSRPGVGGPSAPLRRAAFGGVRVFCLDGRAG